MLDWAATREVTVMPKKRYTPEEIIQHLRTVELETGKGLAVLDACRKLGITEQNAGTVSRRGAVLYTARSADPNGPLADALQHGPSAQQSRGPATRSRNLPACELKANMVGGTKNPGRSVLGTLMPWADRVHYFWPSPLRKEVMVSMGMGKIVVEFFSAAISTRVCKKRSCNAAGFGLMTLAASASF